MNQFAILKVHVLDADTSFWITNFNIIIIASIMCIPIKSLPECYWTAGSMQMSKFVTLKICIMGNVYQQLRRIILIRVRYVYECTVIRLSVMKYSYV